MDSSELNEDTNGVIRAARSEVGASTSKVGENYFPYGSWQEILWTVKG